MTRWLGSVVVGCRTSDGKIASSIPADAFLGSLGQLSLPSFQVDLGVTRLIQSDPTSTWNLAKST